MKIQYARSSTTVEENTIDIQCRRNEFESGGTGPAPSAENFYLVVPLHFLALKAQLVVLVGAFLMASTV